MRRRSASLRMRQRPAEGRDSLRLLAHASSPRHETRPPRAILRVRPARRAHVVPARRPRVRVRGAAVAPPGSAAAAGMFRIEGLGPKMDPEELRRKMRRDVLTSVRNFLIYVALLRISECGARRGARRRGLCPRGGLSASGWGGLAWGSLRARGGLGRSRRCPAGPAPPGGGEAGGAGHPRCGSEAGRERAAVQPRIPGARRGGAALPGLAGRALVCASEACGFPSGVSRLANKKPRLGDLSPLPGPLG